MHCVLKLLTLLLISPAIAENKPQLELKFLNKLLRSVRKEREVQFIYMLQHHRASNCLIDDWNPHGIPIVRSDELSTFELRRNFNTYNALALLCILKSSHYKLLNSLASALDHMRQARIILWSQVRVTGKMLRKICILAERHDFIEIIVLEIIGNESMNAYRLNAFPKPSFERIEDILKSPEVFHRSRIDFKGKTAVVRPNVNRILNVSYVSPKSTFIGQEDDRLIVEFAQRTNLSLKFNPEGISEKFDIELSARLLFKQNIEESVDPFEIVSIIVIVPCGKERSIPDVFKQLHFLQWLLHILIVYAAFVGVECLIRFVIHRITGRAHRSGLLNPLMNLQAFAAILGMPFPVYRRWSPLLRQLFFLLSVFGFVFSNFFACKLSALLTKHSRYAQVRNFEELRLSGLPVVVDDELRSFIDDYADSDFFKWVITTSITVPLRERVRMQFLFNDSFAYIMLREYWPYFDEYQTYMGRRVFCDSKNLTVVANMPRMHTLPKNSIYKVPLKLFVHRMYESGMQLKWMKQSPEMLRKALNITIKRIAKQEAIPLSLEHFNWVWPLVAIGYGIATMVFLIEILLGGGRGCNKRTQPKAQDSAV